MKVELHDLHHLPSGEHTYVAIRGKEVVNLTPEEVDSLVCKYIENSFKMSDDEKWDTIKAMKEPLKINDFDTSIADSTQSEVHNLAQTIGDREHMKAFNMPKGIAPKPTNIKITSMDGRQIINIPIPPDKGSEVTFPATLVISKGGRSVSVSERIHARPRNRRVNVVRKHAMNKWFNSHCRVKGRRRKTREGEICLMHHNGYTYSIYLGAIDVDLDRRMRADNYPTR